MKIDIFWSASRFVLSLMLQKQTQQGVHHFAFDFNLLAFLLLSCLKTFNEHFNSQRTEADILSIVSKAEEFEQLKVRGSPVKAASVAVGDHVLRS